MQETHHIAQLLKKSIEGRLSSAEAAELRAWAGSDAAYQALLNRVNDSHSLEKLLLLRHELDGRDSQDYASQLQGELKARITISSRVSKPRKLRRWLPYVAATLVFLSFGIGIYWYFSKDKQTFQLAGEYADDALPGGNRATLTLADGRMINLSEAKTGIVVDDDNITYKDGNLLTVISSDLTVGEDREPQSALHNKISQLKLTTPRGGTYEITLPDGTKVWLNSASTLKYPSRFDDDARVVELIGEAYFDVTNAAEQKNKNKKRQAWPFRVVSAGQTVEVLGTELNITAYENEPEMKTTLVQGSVQIVNHISNTSNLLKPGEQAINRGGSMVVLKVDVSQFTAWKDGFFYFDGLAPNIALDQLERWYDIEVAYQGSIPSVQFFGMIDRKKPLSAVLNTLSKSGLKFEVEQSGGKSKLTILDE